MSVQYRPWPRLRGRDRSPSQTLLSCISVMSSNSAAAHATSKGLNASSQSSASAQGQSGPSFTTESYSHRRPGGSGSFGAGSASRSGLASARRNQSSRKQHRSQRRSEFADEDAIAESVSQCPRSRCRHRTIPLYLHLPGCNEVDK